MSEVNLPLGWIAITLADLFQPRNTRVNPKSMPDCQYIGLEHVESHTNKLLATVPAKTMSSSSALFFAGDILYGRMRPYLNKVVLPEFDGLASAEFIVLPQVPGVYSRYILRFLSSSKFVEFACSQYDGDRPRVKYEQLAKYRLMLPPTEEQRRIVAKVEALLAHLDNAVTSLDRIKTNLKRYRASVLQAAVEGRLTADWRKQNPPKETSAELLARILKERRAKWEETQLKKYAEQGKTPPRNWKDKYPELVKPDTTGLPDLPEGWAWGTMDTVGEITGGLTKNQRRLSLPLQLPYLRVANVYLNELRLYDVGLIGLEEKELEKVLIRKGDLLIVEGNGSPDQIGRLAIWDGSIEKCVHQNHLIKVRLYENLQPKLAVLWFSSAAGRKCITEVSSSTSGLYTLSVGKVGALPLPLPPLDEQEEIILEVESRLTIADAAEKTVDSALQRAARLRQSILKRAFEGRLVPQDPNDEPASALLERIRAERLKQAATLKPARAKSKLKSRQAETSIGEIGIKGAETA